MEKEILKKSAKNLFFCMIFSWIIFAGLPLAEQAVEGAKKQWIFYQNKTQEKQLKMTGIEIMKKNNALAEKTEKTQLDTLLDGWEMRIELPLGAEGKDIKVEKNDVEQRISIQIPYADSNYIYDYEVIGTDQQIQSLTFEEFTRYGQMNLGMHSVYEIKTKYDKDYFYLDFLTPQEVYDKVILIDAAEGGQDLGTTKLGIQEKDINLDIAIELKMLLDEKKADSVGVYYTRLVDCSIENEKRKKMAELLNADLVISIQMNQTQSGMMSNINGTQVICQPVKEENQERSKSIAQMMLEEVTMAIGSSDKGIVNGSEDVILQAEQVPVVIVEPGFMTNENELKQLATQEYQMKIAQGIYNGLERYFTQEEEK